MVFPIVKTVESACEILNVSIEFKRYLEAKTIAALEATKKRYKHRNIKSVPKNINRYLNLELENRISGSDLNVTKNRLTNLFGAIVPLQEAIDSSRSRGAFPRYGQAINHSLRKIHNSLYEWGCFEGIHSHILNYFFQKIVFIQKHSLSGNIKGSKNKQLLLTGNVSSERILLEAKSILRSIRTSDLGHKLNLQPKDKIYFGLGEASHMLYIHDSSEQDGFVNDSKKIIFQGHDAKIIPIMPDDHQGSSDESNPEYLREKESTRKYFDHVLTRRDFVLISRGLLEDLMIYSKLSWNEGVDTKISTEKRIDDNQQLRLRIGSLWLKYFGLSPEILKKEKDHTSSLNTIIGVMLSSIFMSFYLPIFLSFRKPNLFEEYLSANYPNQTELFLGIIIFLLIGLIIMLPIMFYIINGLVFLTVRLIGGNEGFNYQAYLMSIISVPFSALILLALLIIKIPVVGIFLGSTIIILLVFNLSLKFIRVLQVVYSLTTLKAVTVFVIFAMVVSIFLSSGIALVTLLV